MTVLYFPCVARQRFSDQLRVSDVDWRHKDSKWPQSRHWGNLTLTPSPLWDVSLIGQRNTFWVKSFMFDWGFLAGICSQHLSVSQQKHFGHTCHSPLKFQPFFEFWKGQTYKNSFVRLFWSSLQFFLRRKTSQSSPLDLKLDEMAKQGLDWKDNKILTNTKHDQGRTETIHNIIKYKNTPC